MTQLLVYFYYWYVEDEPMQMVADFSPTEKAFQLVADALHEVIYHAEGDDIDFTFEEARERVVLAQPFNLKPLVPDAWQMELQFFIEKYGNSFVVIDRNQAGIGYPDNYRPKDIVGGQRSLFEEVGPEEPEWTKRAQFEVRLITRLLRWLQLYQRSRWLRAVPFQSSHFNDRVWKLETDIPDTAYSAEWRLVIPETYPLDPPDLFIAKKDVNMVGMVDYGKIWVDPDKHEFFHIPIHSQDSGWYPTYFLVDYLLSGLWNYLVRTLPSTITYLLDLKENFGKPNLVEVIPFEHAPEEELFRWGVFFTWYLQKLPEKALEVLRSILEDFPNHPFLKYVEWRLVVDDLTPEDLTPFQSFVVGYYVQEHERGQLWDRDVAAIRSLLAKWSETDEVLRCKEWLKKIRRPKVTQQVSI